MQTHEARILWRREGSGFLDQRYSRAHEWHFDGGAVVEASASPANVPIPWSVASAVDPEEALVAAVSSCHMLWFLALSARHGFVVDQYSDEAVGILETEANGRKAFSSITLHPRLSFSDRRPTDAELSTLHAEAHDNCYIANSLRCEVIVAPD